MGCFMVVVLWIEYTRFAETVELGLSADSGGGGLVEGIGVGNVVLVVNP